MPHRRKSFPKITHKTNSQQINQNEVEEVGGFIYITQGRCFGFCVQLQYVFCFITN